MEVEAVFGWGVGGSIPGGTVLKNPPANAGDARDMGSGSGSGKSHGQRSLVGYSPMHHKESGSTERPSTHNFIELPSSQT